MRKRRAFLGATR